MRFFLFPADTQPSTPTQTLYEGTLCELPSVTFSGWTSAWMNKRDGGETTKPVGSGNHSGVNGRGEGGGGEWRGGAHSCTTVFRGSLASRRDPDGMSPLACPGWDLT